MDSYRRNELPETVKRYKSYTDQFQDWLIKTALARNVEWAAHIAEQAKKPKGKKTYKISTAQQELLVDGIAETKAPLGDTSGLLDLGDAIRTRKEITQYYRVNQSSDQGHEYFNGALDSFMAVLKALVPVLYRSQDLEDESSNFIVVQFPQDESNKNNDAGNIDEAEEPIGPQEHRQSWKNAGSPKKKSNDNSLTIEEQELQQEFMVLCFLFAFNRIRDVVCDVWHLYHDGIVSAITAALVTDLAQSHIQQNVAALVEELDIPVGQLSEIIWDLYEKMLGSPEDGQSQSSVPQLSGSALCDLLCVHALSDIEAYFAAKSPNTDDSQEALDPQHPALLFLGFYDTIRQKKLKLPLWDKFTEEMLLRPNSSRDWMPFGYQIVLDIQETLQDDYRDLINDVAEHAMDISKLIRLHVDYEDHMWAIGKKPDYMTKEPVKFSTVFLEPLNSLLNWLQTLLQSDDIGDAESKLTTDVFVTVHSTLAGLTMWQFNKLYHSIAIAKVQWFVTCLSHLYNAARQVGGLDFAWPDLDFIIRLHGSERIFLGDPPKDPNDFLERYYLATCVSSRMMASDFRHSGRFAPRAHQEIRNKRGLMAHFPLEEKVKTYYGPNPNNDRWLKRHAIFNHLHQLKEAAENRSANKSQEADQKLKELQDTFASMAKTISPPKSKNRRKKQARVPVPDFSQIDDTYPGLFTRMRIELQCHEVHSNFDYLSFYRRVYDLVLKIRSEVLFDESLAIARQADIDKNPDPGNHNLIAELFRGLKIKPKDEKVETTGDEVSKEVVPVDQLKRIAKMMEGLIREKGSVELERAKMRLSRNWEGLKASYASEEAEQQNSAPETQDLPHDDTEHPDNEEPEVHIDNLRPDIDRVENDSEGSDTEVTNCENVEETDAGKKDRLLPHLENGPEFDVQLDFDSNVVQPKLHQAYVSDEDEDEAASWTLDLQSHLDAIKHKEDSECAQSSTYSGRPKAIFHRRTFNSTLPRKRSVTVKRTTTTARLAFSRPRKGNHHRLTGTARKHSVFMPCYALCSLARALLGRETKFQRRMKTATEILRAWGSRRDSFELKWAWSMSGGSDEQDEAEDGGWEPDVD